MLQKGFKFMKRLLYWTSLLVILLIGTNMSTLTVQGQSMMPNLEDGDYGFSLSTRFLGRYSPIDRFDIVTVESEKTIDYDDTRRIWIKRVIGLPGETIQFKDNVLYINNEIMKEPFARQSLTEDFGPVLLGENEYFVMGDNREVSKDSRYCGAFHREDIDSIGFLKIPYNSNSAN